MRLQNPGRVLKAKLCYAIGGHLPMLRRSGATHDVEDIFEEVSRISPALPEDHLTVPAVTRTPQRTGVWK